MVRHNRTRVLLLTFLTAAAMASGQRYRISIESAEDRVVSGEVWLYRYDWGNLETQKLAGIQNGIAVLPSDFEKLKHELGPNPERGKYVLAINVGQTLWYRTPDLSFNELSSGWLQIFRSLGPAAVAGNNEARLILPAPVKRHITLLYPDNRPAVYEDIDVSVYLTDQNHCGVHTGLPLGTYRTDARGAIEVAAPLVPLYLDNIAHYDEADVKNTGAPYSVARGVKLGSDAAIEVRKLWRFADFEPFPVQGYQVQILSSDGAPRQGVGVAVITNTGCGAAGSEDARTDAYGIARLRFAPQTTPTLSLSPSHGEMPSLTPGEMQSLLRDHKVTVRR
jgi:hypothetical protein